MAAAPSALTLADLQRLLRQPVEVFFRQRLQVEFDELDELEQEDEPFALNHLQQYQAGAALLQADGSAVALRSLHAAGQLPLAGFGARVANDLMDKAQTVLMSRATWLQAYTVTLDAVPIELNLPLGQTLTGTLNGLWSQGQGEDFPCLQLAERTGAVLQGRGANLAARHHVLVGLWLRHLVACASGLHITSVQLGVDGQVVFRPLAADAALATLGRLGQAYAQAWAQPLPVACKTAWAYLLAERQNQALLAAGKAAKDPHESTSDAFEGGQRGGERAESAYLQRAFASYDELADALPHWAQQLYGDLLAQAEVSTGVAA